MRIQFQYLGCTERQKDKRSAGIAPRSRTTPDNGAKQMTDGPDMPSARQVAEAVAQVLRAKLADHDAETISLTRTEAALCLGLAEGVAESLDQ